MVCSFDPSSQDDKSEYAVASTKTVTPHESPEIKVYIYGHIYTLLRLCLCDGNDIEVRTRSFKTEALNDAYTGQV